MEGLWSAPPMTGYPLFKQLNRPKTKLIKDLCKDEEDAASDVNEALKPDPARWRCAYFFFLFFFFTLFILSFDSIDVFVAFKYHILFTWCPLFWFSVQNHRECICVLCDLLREINLFSSVQFWSSVLCLLSIFMFFSPTISSKIKAGLSL